jgi:hypothetical protein
MSLYLNDFCQATATLFYQIICQLTSVDVFSLVSFNTIITLTLSHQFSREVPMMI